MRLSFVLALAMLSVLVESNPFDRPAREVELDERTRQLTEASNMQCPEGVIPIRPVGTDRGNGGGGGGGGPTGGGTGNIDIGEPRPYHIYAYTHCTATREFCTSEDHEFIIIIKRLIRVDVGQGGSLTFWDQSIDGSTITNKMIIRTEENINDAAEPPVMERTEEPCIVVELKAGSASPSKVVFELALAPKRAR